MSWDTSAALPKCLAAEMSYCRSVLPKCLVTMADCRPVKCFALFCCFCLWKHSFHLSSCLLLSCLYDTLYHILTQSENSLHSATCTRLVSMWDGQWVHDAAVELCRLSTVGNRAFPIAASRVWNYLPPHVTAAESLPVFCSRLKTRLFKRCFSWHPYCSRAREVTVSFRTR